jgi:hypothetical protein
MVVAAPGATVTLADATDRLHPIDASPGDAIPWLRAVGVGRGADAGAANADAG